MNPITRPASALALILSLALPSVVLADGNTEPLGGVTWVPDVEDVRRYAHLRDNWPHDLLIMGEDEGFIKWFNRHIIEIDSDGIWHFDDGSWYDPNTGDIGGVPPRTYGGSSGGGSSGGGSSGGDGGSDGGDNGPGLLRRLWDWAVDVVTRNACEEGADCDGEDFNPYGNGCPSFGSCLIDASLALRPEYFRDAIDAVVAEQLDYTTASYRYMALSAIDGAVARSQRIATVDLHAALNAVAQTQQARRLLLDDSNSNRSLLVGSDPAARAYRASMIAAEAAMASTVNANLRELIAELAAQDGYAVVIDSSDGSVASETTAARAADLTGQVVSAYDQRFQAPLRMP